jgi:hypothetical protein
MYILYTLMFLSDPVRGYVAPPSIFLVSSQFKYKTMNDKQPLAQGTCCSEAGTMRNSEFVEKTASI